MTKAKILRAKKLLDAGEVEKDERYASHTAAQMEDLLNTKALVQGEVDSWIGFKWLATERLLTDGSSDRLCYLWQKKAIQLAISKEATGRVDERPDKNYAWQVYLKLCLGAVRLEEARIVEVACSES